MKIRIGTRASKLALTQTEMVQQALKRLDRKLQVEVIHITTIGDRKQGTPLAAKGDKRDWIHDLEIALQTREIDLAVHSAKDVPADYAEGTEIFPVLPRAAAGDVFIGAKQASGQRMRFADLPQGALVGTASLRRKAQLLRWRPDLRIVDHRGNVPTRIEKLDNSSELSGIILAQAGIERLELMGLSYETISPEILLPAINQGILSVQIRRNDSELQAVVERLKDIPTDIAFKAERGVVSILKGDCASAVSIFATATRDTVTVTSRVSLPDGTQLIESSKSGLSAQSWMIGQEVAKELMDMGAEALLKESRLVAQR